MDWASASLWFAHSVASICRKRSQLGYQHQLQHQQQPPLAAAVAVVAVAPSVLLNFSVPYL